MVILITDREISIFFRHCYRVLYSLRLVTDKMWSGCIRAWVWVSPDDKTPLEEGRAKEANPDVFYNVDNMSACVCVSVCVNVYLAVCIHIHIPALVYTNRLFVNDLGFLHHSYIISELCKYAKTHIPHLKKLTSAHPYSHAQVHPPPTHTRAHTSSPSLSRYE